MNIPNLPSLHPNKIGARRAIRLRLINERKIVKDIHPTHLLVDNIATIRDLKRLGELGHLARVGRWAPVARVHAALEASAGRTVRDRDSAVAPAVEVRVAGGFDDGARVPIALGDGVPGLLLRPGKLVRRVEDPVAVVGDD